jgi:DNA helicase-2/ATP-dependent DNA helicase PcrA
MELNPQQQRAVEYDQGHVLVLAGAGTGKTRTITARAAHLIRTGVNPMRILLLTFTRRAAKEMSARLETIIGPDSTAVMAGTFHHFCLYTMRRMGGMFGIGNATVIDRDDQIQLMRLVRGSLRKNKESFPTAAELVNLCSFARNTTQPVAKYLQRHSEYDDEMNQRIVQAIHQYDRRKQENNYLDYDDILFRFAKTLHEDAEVRQRLRGFFDHILVDEMQDTNPLQWLILDGLRDPAQLFCVGDDAQSIYAFRGADFRNVHKFTDRVPGAVVLKLEENYRSTQGILDLSNWLLSASSLNYGKRLRAHRRTVSQPRLLEFETDFDEARWIVGDLIDRHGNGARWDEQMIITRTGIGARAVESFMVEKQVPYRFIGGVSLLQAAHVKDLLGLVRAAASQHDELAWARYLTLWPRIGDVTAARLIASMRQEASLHSALENLRKALKNRATIVEGPETVRSHWASPPTAIEQAGLYLSPLLERKYADWPKRRQDFVLLTRLAENHRSLMAFLETYTLDPISMASAQQLEGEDMVTLTTAHSAKGTEAIVCYLIRVEPGMYPHIRSIGDVEAEEEERRILYVAMTRAKDELIVTRSRRFGGRFTAYSSYGHASRGSDEYLLNDLDDRLIDIETATIRPPVWSDYDDIRPWDRD